MWLMLQQQTPDDYVLATGETHSVREFIEKAFGVLNLSIRWEGTKENEVGRSPELQNKIVVRVSPKYYRPTEVDLLLGNPTKAKKHLGWVPKCTFNVSYSFLFYIGTCGRDGFGRSKGCSKFR